MAYNLIEYRLTNASDVSNLVTDASEASSIPTTTGAGTILANTLPNQLWKGYQDETAFANSYPKPSKIAFRNFGKSVNLYGCAVCCCAGASALLTGIAYPLDYMYENGCFKWNPKVVDSHGVPCGTTLAQWYQMNKIGIKINSQNSRYDYERKYPWLTAKSKNVFWTSADTLAAQFYMPDATATYNQGLTDNYSGTGTQLLAQKNYCAGQVYGLQRIANDLSQNTSSTIKKVDILYICSSKRKCGHYVLAVYYTQQHSGYRSVDDVMVLDPCATKLARTSYYGAYMSLPNAMKRINADISDGIHSILTVTLA